METIEGNDGVEEKQQAPSVVIIDPIRPYIRIKYPPKNTYETLISMLKDLAAQVSERKRVRDIVPVLKELTLYDLRPDTFQYFLALLKHEDKKVLILTHYCMRMLAPALRGDEKLLEKIDMKPLYQEIHSSAVERRASAIRTISLILPVESNQSVKTTLSIPISQALEQSSLSALLHQQLKDLERSGSEVQSKKGFKSLFDRGSTTENRSVRQRVVFSACLHRRLFPVPMMGQALEGMISSNPVTARHALALVENFSSDSPGIVASSLRRHLPFLVSNIENISGGSSQSIGSPPKSVHDDKTAGKGEVTMNLVDVQARVFLARISANIIAAGNDNAVPRETRETFLDTLWALTRDTNSRVFFTAVQGLSRVHWGLLVNAMTTDKPTGGGIFSHFRRKSSSTVVLDPKNADSGSKKQLLPEVVRRCVSLLSLGLSGGQYQLMLHMCCRTIALLGQCYVKSSQRESSKHKESKNKMNVPGTDEEEETKPVTRGPNPFNPLLAPLLHVAVSVDNLGIMTPDVRAQATIALIWCSDAHTNVDDCQFLRDIMTRFFLAPTSESKSTNETVGRVPVLSLVTASRLRGMLFKQLYARLKAAKSTLFLELVCDLAAQWASFEGANIDLILSTWRTAVKGADNEHRSFLLEILFSFLDRVSSYTERGSALPSHWINVRRAVFWFLGEYGNLICDERAERYTEKGKASTATDPRGGNYELTLVTDIGGDASIPFLSDTQNPAMKSVVLRLQHGCAFCERETRIVCVTALSKLAFRSGDPLRLHIYEYFATMVSDPSAHVSIITVLRPLLAVLDSIYLARSRFLSIVRLETKKHSTGSGLDADGLDFLDSIGQDAPPNASIPPEELSEDGLKEIFENHKKVLSQISLYCYLPQSFTPLGLDSTDYVALAWSKFAGSRKHPSLRRQASWEDRVLARRVSSSNMQITSPGPSNRADEVLKTPTFLHLSTESEAGETATPTKVEVGTPKREETAKEFPQEEKAESEPTGDFKKENDVPPLAGPATKTEEEKKLDTSLEPVPFTTDFGSFGGSLFSSDFGDFGKEDEKKKVDSSFDPFGLGSK